MSERPRIEELKRRVQVDPASIAFAALAEEFRRMGRHAEAIEVCRLGLQSHPSYISAHVTLGRALIETGRFDEARRELEDVLSVAPENLAAIRGLAEIHDRQRQSADHPDLIASEMADVLAQPAPLPSVPAGGAWNPAPDGAGEPPPRPVLQTLVPTQRPVFDAPPQPAPLVELVDRPREDPALPGLEVFLEAIVRAREAAAGVHAF